MSDKIFPDLPEIPLSREDLKKKYLDLIEENDERTLGLFYTNLSKGRGVEESYLDAVEKSLEEVSDSLKKKIEKVVQPSVINFPKKYGVDNVKWVVEDWFEAGCFSIIGGVGGMGKTTLSIKIAVMNSMRKEFWAGGPVGDGRKSLYICSERGKDRAFAKMIACGGEGDSIDILWKVRDKAGKYVSFNLNDQFHLKQVLDHILQSDYAFVIFDPLVDLCLDDQNKNSAVREKLTKILEKFEDKNTALLGLMHLRKERRDITDMDAFRGASEWANVATSCHIIKELKNDEGFLLLRCKVNESLTSTRGGLKFKVQSVKIPEGYRDPKHSEVTRGGIEAIIKLNKPKDSLLKLCVQELGNFKGESDQDKIQRVIHRLDALNQLDITDTSTIRKLILAEGVTEYFYTKKFKWANIGYKTIGQGQGKHLRYFLKKI